MNPIIDKASFKVKARKAGTTDRPTELNVRDISGVPFAAEGDTPYSFAVGPVTLKIEEYDTINELLKNDEVEFFVYINDGLAFKGYAEAPYGFDETNLGRNYNITVKPRVMDKTIDISDPRTGENYPYIFVEDAVELVLEAAGVPERERIINIPELEFDAPAPQVINRATVDLADSDVTYTTARPVSNAVKISGYVYIGIGNYIVAYKDHSWYRVGKFPVAYEIRALAVDGTDLIVRLFTRDMIYEETITPAPRLDLWEQLQVTATPYQFYADGYQIESKATRWKTYGAEESEGDGPTDNTAFFFIQSIGHAPPTSTKESGVADIWPRGEADLERDIEAGAYTIYVNNISDPDDVGLDIDNLISITGHNSEHLGRILNVTLIPPSTYQVVIEKRTQHFHGEDEAVHWYAPSEYMVPNLLFFRYDKLHINYEDENEIGGRYEIIEPNAVQRIDDEDIINEYYKPVSTEASDKEIELPRPAWYSFIAESNLEALVDRHFADLPRKFYLNAENYTPVPREKAWAVKYTTAERYGQAEYQMVEYNGTWILTIHGRVEFDGDYCVYEDFLYNDFDNVITNVTFNYYDGSAVRMLYRYRKNTDYEGKPELFLTGNIKYHNGSIYGCGKTVEREFLPLHSKIIGAANPRDANDEIPDDANTKGVVIIVLEGDCTDWLEEKKAVKIGGDTTSEPFGREYEIISVDSGYRQFVQRRVMTRDDISFHDDTPVDYIWTADGNFKGKFEPDEYITISGSTHNDGTYKIMTVTEKMLRLYTTAIVNESAGADITITGGNDDLVKCSAQDWQFDDWDGNTGATVDGGEIAYSGYVTWAMIMIYDGANPKEDFCGKYVWFENRIIKRAVLIEYDTNTKEESGPLTLTELTLNTDTPHDIAERQKREKEGTRGVEPKLLEDENWPHGKVYKLERDAVVSSIRVFRGDHELNVENRSAYRDVPKPGLDTAYVVENRGINRDETWIYVQGEIRASYDYYPEVEITAVFVLDDKVYFSDSEGWIYDESFTEYGNAGGAIGNVYEETEQVWYITNTGLFGVFSTAPPAVAEDFGGEDTAVAYLGALTRQSLTSCFEYAGRYYFGTEILDEALDWDIMTADTDESMPSVAVEINQIRAGDLKALDGVETLNAPYTLLSEQLAEKIFDRVERRRLVYITAKAENPHRLIGTAIHRGINYKIIGIDVLGNEASVTAEAIGTLAEAKGIKAATR